MKRVAAACVALFASGCATVEPNIPVRDWPERRTALQAFDEWRFDGRIALAAGNEGFSGGLDWRQNGAAADISLRGPLGGGAILIHVDGREYVVTDRRGTTYDGEAARRYLEERFGAQSELPIMQMRFWLVGAPAPGAPHRETLDEDERLASLEQSGWLVQYERYSIVGDMALPERLEMTAGDLRLRVVVANWQLGT
jgi:outer membrane lipoprotein LolB